VPTAAVSHAKCLQADALRAGCESLSGIKTSAQAFPVNLCSLLGLAASGRHDLPQIGRRGPGFLQPQSCALIGLRVLRSLVGGQDAHQFEMARRSQLVTAGDSPISRASGIGDLAMKTDGRPWSIHFGLVEADWQLAAGPSM
jgi:hypothetical protein